MWNPWLLHPRVTSWHFLIICHELSIYHVLDGQLLAAGLRTHHFHFLPVLCPLVNPETESTTVSLISCMAWDYVMPGMILTTSSIIISWCLMAKRHERTSVCAKGRMKGNRPYADFMTTTTNYCMLWTEIQVHI